MCLTGLSHDVHGSLEILNRFKRSNKQWHTGSSRGVLAVSVAANIPIIELRFQIFLLLAPPCLWSDLGM